MSNKTVSARRKLIKSLAAGGGIAMLPDHWRRPAVDISVLPAHAQMTCSAVYAVEGFFADGFKTNETATICAIICGDIADVTFQTFFVGDTPQSGSDVRRTGNIPTNGTSGTMAITQTSPTCTEFLNTNPRSATLTDLTENSVVYTMIRGQNAPGPLVAVLTRVDRCPDFPPLEWVCETP